VGILGLGYIGLETYANPSQQQYLNLPVLMYNQSLIDCIAYSLWLDPSRSDHGRLVFGGLDTGKFIGSLETLHISMDNYDYHYATITMDSLALSLNGKHVTVSDGPMQVSPDSGATEIYLPTKAANRIFVNFGAVYDYEYSVAVVDCGYKSNATTLDFIFGSTTISVPMNELFTTYNATLCYLNIQPTNASLSFGLAFLRSTYVVYDFSNNQVSLAPTNPGITTDNVTVIGPNGISGAGFIGTGPSSTTSSAPNNTTSPAAATSSTSPSGLTTGAKIGIGVGVPLGVIALLAVGAVFVFRHRRQPRNNNTEVPQASPLPPKSEPYSSHRTSELETSQRFSSMSPSSFRWRHEYSPVQPGLPEFRPEHEEMRELEA
jgi:Eukaryotic aspartyl protease